MQRWRFSHGVVGVNAPSWLTFEVHRPYFDGADSPLTTVQARAGLLAARRFEQRDLAALRFGMNMPASYRTLLTQESRLHAYRVTRPTDLPSELASPAWARLADAYTRRAELDRTDTATLAHWLVAVCLPAAVLDLVPEDLSATECADEANATVQAARATALFQLEGLSDRTAAAYRALADEPARTLCHVQALAAWAYLQARHAGDDAAAPGLARQARTLLDQVAPDIAEFDHTIVAARLDLRESMHAERHSNFDAAARTLSSAAEAVDRLEASNAEDGLVLLEMRRRLVDRRVEIAVRLGDREAERAALAEGIELDPYCVKIRMQAAQAEQRAGRHDQALAGYLHAARLGPFGTAAALLAAAECARLSGHAEFARVLSDRAFRSAPRSQRTRDALIETCVAAGDESMAEVARRAGRQDREHPYHGNWHYQMYASYFNLGESLSPSLYARLPSLAYEFATTGALADINWQRQMPPAFRTNLVRESGLAAFEVDHPAGLPERLRTPAWEQLCAWVAEFDDSDTVRQVLTCSVLYRLGFGPLVLDLVAPRPAHELSGADELLLHHWRDMVRYVGSVGKQIAVPTTSFEIARRPDCPPRLRFVIAVFAVVFHARETKSLQQAQQWRELAERMLPEVLADPAASALDRMMLESRFYRSVTYVPFLQRDQARLAAEMDRAEQLARAIEAATPYEEFVRRENLRACLETRSKEAIGFGQDALAHSRIEQVLAIDPYEPKSHIELAESLARQGRDREAAESYLRAARLGPTSTALSYGMAGECYVRAGLPALAEDCFIQSLRVDPYAASSARGWAKSSVGGEGMGVLGAQYLADLEAWAQQRRAARAQAVQAQ